jgi:hypothetical protein
MAGSRRKNRRLAHSPGPLGFRIAKVWRANEPRERPMNIAGIPLCRDHNAAVHRRRPDTMCKPSSGPKLLVNSTGVGLADPRQLN